MITTDSFEILQEGFQSTSVKECFGLSDLATVPSSEDLRQIEALMQQMPR